MNCLWIALALLCVGGVRGQTDDQIRVVSDEIWQADYNRITGSDVQYNVNGDKLFTYVNEARFTGTYARLIDLFDNYVAETGVPDQCGSTCEEEQTAFLDAIISTRPLILLQNFLFGYGLASASPDAFKEELRQYLFMAYTRSGGPLDSSGFEHVFLGEIDDGEAKGFHNWVQAYYSEKNGDFVYGSYQDTCANEVLKFSFELSNYQKPVSSMFIRTSPEVEVALYTLCLLTKNGSCPVRRDGVDLSMTVWDMTGLPKTIGSAYPSC